MRLAALGLVVGVVLGGLWGQQRLTIAEGRLWCEKDGEVVEIPGAGAYGVCRRPGDALGVVRLFDRRCDGRAARAVHDVVVRARPELLPKTPLLGAEGVVLRAHRGLQKASVDPAGRPGGGMAVDPATAGGALDLGLVGVDDANDKRAVLVTQNAHRSSSIGESTPVR